jgi:hypothetical protein
MTTVLISLLRMIDADNSILVVNGEYSVTHPLVNAAKYLSGQYMDVNALTKAGFHVFPNTLNKSGWVTEYIMLRNGRITYNTFFSRYI